ncbi:aspartate transaminase [Microbacterium oryzae]|uniref:aspartate transaminase n=1 Tax=Microbacterium oryzae TaxID=743009 RepID=UPI0025B03918|nr:aspartate transaminase [Microbacterium oryzae]MDN3312100.1 aspartate transaminase [Microbacterium oryzae]
MTTTTTAFVPARRVQRIKESPSSAAAARVRELKAQGRRILDLTVGEPDFDTPANVKVEAIRAIEAGETKYTPVNGTPRLRAAIRERMLRTTGVEYADDQITVGGGGKQVIYLTFTASLDEGDEVIIPAPYWVSYPDMVRANDGTPVILETTAENRYKVTAEALRAAITPRTKWLVLNAPSNPTGVLYSRDELEALGRVLEDAPHVRVLTDEIYDEIVFGDERAVGLAQAAPAIRDRVLTVNGVSKSYAMTGWRLGYAVGDPGVVKAINLLQSQTSSCPSSITQAAAAEALTGDQSFIDESVSVYRERRDRAVELLSAIDGLTPVTPDGAFYLFVDCSGLIGRRTPDGTVLENDQDLTLYLLDHAGVAVIQGSAYGVAPFFRMSFATDLDTIEAGAAAIAGAVADLR